jgi:hypothetical protein
MPKVRMTDSEKRQRGTFQAARGTKARDLAAVQADIAQAQETLESIQLTAREAGKSIRQLGVLIPSGRGATSTHKPNPCVRIQGWALGAIRGLKRDLVFLREEEQSALQAQKPEHNEFEGLD